MNGTTSTPTRHRAPAAITVRLDAALVHDLRRVLDMAGDPFATPPRTPARREREQSQRNRIAVETAMRAYVRQDEACRAHLKGSARWRATR